MNDDLKLVIEKLDELLRRVEALERRNLPLGPRPFIPPIDGDNFPDYPNHWVVPPEEKCAFDGLPPGAYGLVCYCPRCRPSFAVPPNLGNKDDITGRNQC